MFKSVSYITKPNLSHRRRNLIHKKPNLPHKCPNRPHTSPDLSDTWSNVPHRWSNPLPAVPKYASPWHTLNYESHVTKSSLTCQSPSHWCIIWLNGDQFSLTCVKSTSDFTKFAVVNTHNNTHTVSALRVSSIEGKTGVTADRDKIEFSLFNSRSIFNITLREELLSSLKQKTNHASLYVVYDNYMSFNLKKNCMSYKKNFMSFKLFQ